jgi:hypothetical protein
MAKLERDPNKVTDPQRFYDRAKELTDNVRKHMLSFSTAIIAGLVYFQLNRNSEADDIDNVLFISSLIIFGLGIYSAILSLKWESSKNYFLGEMNNPQCNTEYEAAKERKDHFNKRTIKAKSYNYYLFLIGVALSLSWLIKMLIK